MAVTLLLVALAVTLAAAFVTFLTGVDDYVTFLAGAAALVTVFMGFFGGAADTVF